MTEPRVKGGYILLSRTLIESEIWDKPPLYLKIWIYLLSKAQHKDYKGLKRGQVLTSIPEIQEACSYNVGFRKEMPSYNQVRRALDWMRETGETAISSDLYERNTNATPNHITNEAMNATTKATTNDKMITTTKHTQGMVVNIENYAIYQDPKSYERHNERQEEAHIESHNEAHTEPHNERSHERNMNDKSTISNKNDKNDYKNDKKDIVGQESPDPIPYAEIVNYLNARTGRSYKATSGKTRNCIKARWNEGFRLDDFKRVIDIKAKEWLNDGKMNRYLRPETLFGPKFDGYLNQKDQGQDIYKPKGNDRPMMRRKDEDLQAMAMEDIIKNQLLEDYRKMQEEGKISPGP